MSYTPEQIAQIKVERPNLWRLACELSKFKDPYRVANALLAAAGPMLKQEEDTRV